MDKYNQITEEERYQIWANKKVGFSVPQIAEELGRKKSTMHHELGRNAGDIGYRPKQTNKARQRKSESAKSIKMTAELIDLIEKNSA
jgi:IS30 family transposase